MKHVYDSGPRGRWVMVDGLAAYRPDGRAPSLRDEVAEIVRIKNSGHSNAFYDARADAVLAVVRRHVESLPVPVLIGDSRWCVYRDDVLTLLEASDE